MGKRDLSRSELRTQAVNAGLTTIGYEGAPLAAVLDELKREGVELLVDVRAVASSRRAGFSKTLLAGSLNGVGIDYLHLRALGTPKEGRIAARAGRTSEMRDIFATHLEGPEPQAALDEATRLATKRRICLLCFEEDYRCCHRALLAELIEGRTGVEARHLKVRTDPLR